MMSYIHAWIYVILLPCTIFAKDSNIFNPLSVFLTGLVIVHGCALVAAAEMVLSIFPGEPSWVSSPVGEMWNSRAKAGAMPTTSINRRPARVDVVWDVLRVVVFIGWKLKEISCFVRAWVYPSTWLP